MKENLMQPVQDVEVYDCSSFLLISGDRKDIQAWTDLLAEDAVVEFHMLLPLVYQND